MSKLIPGTMIGEYTLTTDLSPKDAGTSMWGFATRGRDQFFIKQHTSPKWPLDGYPGSEQSKRRRRAECHSFEVRKRRLREELATVGGDGAMVIVTDVFRHNAHYYTVTPKVDVSGLSTPQIATLSLDVRYVILASTANALAAVHSRRIVHSDIKPANVLVKRTSAAFAARLIDFDGCYFEGDPPEAENLAGDPAYFSPEMLEYIKTDGYSRRDDLGIKSDTFAAGLLFVEHLTGERVPYGRDRGFQSPAHAVAEGETLHVPDIAGVPRHLIDVIGSMLLPDPGDRPSMVAVNRAIRDARMGRSVDDPSTAGSTAPATGTEPGVLKVPRVPDDEHGAVIAPPAPPASLKPPRRSRSEEAAPTDSGKTLKPPRNRR